MNISEAMYICLKNGIEVSPLYDNKARKFKIQSTVKGSGTPIVYPKEINQSEINDALIKTYIFLANKIK